MAELDLNALRDDIRTTTEAWEALRAKADQARDRWRKVEEEVSAAYAHVAAARERFTNATKDIVPRESEGVLVE